MAGLPRDIIKWLQSLSLSLQVRNPKWDFTNGYLVAEIFSWYYPSELSMHSFNKGQSIDSKLKNWSLLRNFIQRHNLTIPEDYIDATIHCKEGGAHLLIKNIYESLTNRRVTMLNVDKVDFTDGHYQLAIPSNARSTAAKQLKNNLALSELIAEPNIMLTEQKAQYLLMKHKILRQMEREEEPDRYGVKPTLGQQCPRVAPRKQTFFAQTETSLLPDVGTRDDDEENVTKTGTSKKGETISEFKVSEVPVRQTAKAGNYQPLVIG
jgi:hypothetical protein